MRAGWRALCQLHNGSVPPSSVPNIPRGPESMVWGLRRWRTLGGRCLPYRSLPVFLHLSRPQEMVLGMVHEGAVSGLGALLRLRCLTLPNIAAVSGPIRGGILQLACPSVPKTHSCGRARVRA